MPTPHSPPLIDLHRHLDGNVRLQTIIDLAKTHKIDVSANNIRELSKLVYVQDTTPNLMTFLTKLDIGVSVLASLDDCYRIAYENIVDAISEKLDYTELRFSPYYMSLAHALPLEGVVEAVVAGVSTANKDYNYTANLIGILSRTYGVEACAKELHAILTARDDIVALDLAGDELGYPAALFVDHFNKARDAGFKVTVHAGETDGPGSIWDAIRLLGATRIGHGVAAIQDPELLSYMAKHKIGIETCLLSNYQTGTWSDTATHPVKTFLEQGIEVCLNTDDPGISNNTLSDEYLLATNLVQLTPLQINTLKRNALKQAFLSIEQKNALISR